MVAFGEPHEHFRATDSTNARARERAEEGAPCGLVVTAGEQSAGRGRQGRDWFAPPGSALLYSALLRPLGDRPLLPLAVPLAVAEAGEALGIPRCGVKWPNDVWVGDRKLAGVLIESRAGAGDGGWAVIGIGLNLTIGRDDFPDELRGRATSVLLERDGSGIADRSTRGPTADEALASLNPALGRWCDAPETEILAGFRSRDALRGRSLTWDEGSEEGVAEGIDDSGHLLVRKTNGEQVKLGAGEVHLRVNRSP